MHPQIPLEILDYIFLFLRDDHASLRSCAEVNTICSDTVERHLYHRLKLVNLEELAEIDQITPAAFMKLFTVTPRLAFHVKILDIMFFSTAETRRYESYLHADDVGQTLHLLSQVTEISLYGTQTFQWSSFHPIFREAFSQIIIQPSVELIRIYGTSGFPLPLFNDCSSLKYLFLYKLVPSISNMSDSSTKCLSPDRKRPKPICLYIDLSPCGLSYSLLPSILTWLRSPQSPRIFVLSTDVRGPPDVRGLQDIMDYCANELEEVHLLSDEIARMADGFTLRQELLRPGIGPHPMAAPDFSRMRVLEAISLTGSIEAIFPYRRRYRPDQLIYTSCIPWFIQVLETFGRSDTPNRLEDVNLDITFVVDEVSLATQVDWEPLVTVLQWKCFSSLRVIRLKCSWVSSQTWTLDIPGLKSTLSQDVHLSSLIQCGLLLIRGPSEWT